MQSIGTPLGMPINVTKPPTDDPLVRQAIMYAVDQKTLVNEVLFGVDTPAHTVLTPITPGYSARRGACTPTTRPKPRRCSTRPAGRPGPAASG